MSRKKKLSRSQKVRARLQRQQEKEYGAGPPIEAVEAYAEAYMWATKNPGKATELASLDGEAIQSLVIGIAYPEQFNIPESEVLTVAGQIKTWHILNGFKYFYDWWEVPIAEMTPEAIIDQIRIDRDNGKVVILDDPEE